MRGLTVAIVSLIAIACGGPTAPTDAPAVFFVRVQNLNGPPASVLINGTTVATTSCGDQRDLTVQPGVNGVADLPWTVSLVAHDGTELASTTMDGSLSHVVSMFNDTMIVDDPTPNPGMLPWLHSCPSLYFDTSQPG